MTSITTRAPRSVTVYDILARTPNSERFAYFGQVEAHSPQQARRRALAETSWSANADQRVSNLADLRDLLHKRGEIVVYAVPTKNWQGVSVKVERTSKVVINDGDQ